jgi:glycine/D-amino acid oxidase-like deaminating enzyme
VTSSLAAPAVAALADVRFAPYWLEASPEPAACPPLSGPTTADLAVVGAGYTGLWTALLAKEADPSRDIVVLEARTAGWAASGRNGGFCAASLTHGLRNGADRFPAELGQLERLGADNLAAIEDTLGRHGIDCDWERTGELTVATAPWQLDGLRELPELARRHGGDLQLLDAAQVRELVDSPTYLGGVLDRTGVAMVDPARLARGLKEACLRVGVRVFEHTSVESVGDERGAGLGLHTPYGVVSARRVGLATNAFRPLLRRLRSYIAPVYDYALVTEPLSAEQLASVGWRGREGLTDAGNQFHYYRLTPDNRILWGGYDAVYHYGNRVDDELDRNAGTFALLAEHFFTTFPPLLGVRFTHAWGGVIDTCSRFCVFWGRAYGDRLAYAAGYTGLGVGASRFGARVLLDLLSGRETELTRLTMVRRKPLPFPPEPVRWAGIELTRRAIARADRRDGRRGPWLRTLDRIGMGFDS